MNRATLYNDLAQLWLQIDILQTLYFEPGRTQYRAALLAAGASAPITADPTQVAFLDNLAVSVPGETGAESDAELSVLVVGHLMAVLTALGADINGSQRGIDLLARLSEVALPDVSGISAVVLRQREQRQQLTRLLNIAAFYQLAGAVVEHDYQDKQRAHDNRLRFTEIGMALQHTVSATNDLELYQQIVDLIALVGDAFRGFADSLLPVGYYAPVADLSVLAVGWNLYRSADWAADLVARNHNGASILLRQPVEFLQVANSARTVR